MDCPKCIGIMKELIIPGRKPLAVNQCPICGGLWFDRNELPQVLSSRMLSDTELRLELDARFDEELLSRIDLDGKEIECPRCQNGVKMKKIPAPRKRGVRIDYCARCSGIWLDKGEYDRIRERSVAEQLALKFVSFLKNLRRGPKKP